MKRPAQVNKPATSRTVRQAPKSAVCSSASRPAGRSGVGRATGGSGGVRTSGGTGAAASGTSHSRPGAAKLAAKAATSKATKSAKPKADRPASRPAGGTSGAGPGRGLRRRPLRLSSIHPVTAVVISCIVMAMVVAPSYLRPWLQQRATIAQQREKVVDLQRDIAEYERQRRQLDDPAYLKTQARQRLNMVMPGETSYRLVDTAPRGAVSDPREPATVIPHVQNDKPWYDAMWSSVRQASVTRQSVTP